MKYEAPELTALTPAINAIQGAGTKNVTHPIGDGDTSSPNESLGAYADWE